jgi:hypothetical protein
MKKNYIYKYNISSLQNNLRNDIKNKNCEDIKSILNNSINLDSELPEIKEEVKEIADLPQTNVYNSPQKKPKNHFYITKKEINYIYNRDEKGEEEDDDEIIENNDDEVFEDYNSNNNDRQILIEKRENDENNLNKNNNIENKNNIEINQIYGKKYYTYTHKKNLENNTVLKDEPKINKNIIYNKYNKKEMNNNLDNSNMENYQNKIIKDNNIRINNNNNINFKENYDRNENYRYNNIIRLSNNTNNKLDNEINYKKDFNKNSVIINENKPYNILISKYLNFNHHQTEKKNLTNKSKKDIKYNISNIVPSNLEKKNQEHNVLNENSGSSRFRPYRRYNNLINIINDKDDNKGDVDIKIIDKDKNKKKHKGENKIKYNNLIKLKLSKCDSINKRKNIKNNNINY